MLQTNRGCPFSCSFCTDGRDAVNQVNRFSQDRVKQEIEYITRNKVGIFVSKRDLDSFSTVVKYVMDNYTKIQKSMEKNILPTKKSMIKQISDIIKLQNL